jgi:hypothetical protein
MKTFRTTFHKHFNADGMGDDYPTDTLHTGDIEVIPDFVEMIPPADEADKDEDGGAYGFEVWDYDVANDDASAFENRLQRCDIVKTFSVIVKCDECAEPAKVGYRVRTELGVSDYAFCAKCDPGRSEDDEDTWTITPAAQA